MTEEEKIAAETAKAEEEKADAEAKAKADAEASQQNLDIDYEAIAKAERERREAAERLLAEDRYNASRNKRETDEEREAREALGAEEDKPITAKELPAILARERQVIQKESQQERALEVARANNHVFLTFASILIKLVYNANVFYAYVRQLHYEDSATHLRQIKSNPCCSFMLGGNALGFTGISTNTSHFFGRGANTFHATIGSAIVGTYEFQPPPLGFINAQTQTLQHP